MDDLAGLQFLQSLVLGDDLAMGRKNARNPHEVENLDPGVAQRQLETLQPRTVLAQAIGKKTSFGTSGSPTDVASFFRWSLIVSRWSRVVYDQRPTSFTIDSFFLHVVAQ